MPQPVFPPANWDGSEVRFHSDSIQIPPARPYAVVVFAKADCGFVLAHVPRGWCVPSGRLEAGETPLETAVRETYEEIGAELLNPKYIGWFHFLAPDGGERIVPAFTGSVLEWGDLPAESESTDVRCATMAELPPIYWKWDALMQAVFAYAEQTLARSM